MQLGVGVQHKCCIHDQPKIVCRAAGQLASNGQLRVGKDAAQVQAPLEELELARALRRDAIRVCRRMQAHRVRLRLGVEGRDVCVPLWSMRLRAPVPARTRALPRLL